MTVAELLARKGQWLVLGGEGKLNPAVKLAALGMVIVSQWLMLRKRGHLDAAGGDALLGEVGGGGGTATGAQLVIIGVCALAVSMALKVEVPVWMLLQEAGQLVQLGHRFLPQVSLVKVKVDMLEANFFNLLIKNWLMHII